MAVEGIILAAGLSSRAKTFKMTLRLNNSTIIENVIDSMKRYTERIILVGGYKIEKLEPIVKKYNNVDLVFNENFKEGMFASVKKGLGYVSKDKFFFTPGDYPLIDSEVYETLLNQDGDIVIPTHKGRRGHPILMKSCLKNEILYGEFSNLREFIECKKPTLTEVDCKGILLDIDTLEDYESVLQSSLNEMAKGG